jgi:chemotaxis response regulator CheB
MKAKPFIIGIGASKGEFGALQELFANFPHQLKNTIVLLAWHLSHAQRHLLAQLLGYQTEWEVSEAIDGAEVETGKVYVTPADKAPS